MINIKINEKYRVTSDSRQIRLEKKVGSNEKGDIFVADLSVNSVGDIVKSLKRKTIYSVSDTNKIISTLEDFKIVEEESMAQIKDVMEQLAVQIKEEFLAVNSENIQLKEDIKALEKKIEYYKNKVEAE